VTQDEESALRDIRVLDIAGEIGLYCTKLLADVGADVIQVESPCGHPARGIGPFYHDEIDPEKSLYFFNLTTNKKSITLDLDSSDGRDLFRRLVPTTDVVVESFPPGHLDRLGLGYSGLIQIRPDIVLTSITGFGQWGPHSRYKTSDIVGLAMSGVMWLAGEAEDPPNRFYGNQGYISASIQAAAGTLLALYHRDVTGEGQQVDVSMQEALSMAQETSIQSWDLANLPRRRIGAARIPGMTVPGIGPYECKDGYVFGYLGTPGGAPWTEMLRWMVDEGKAEDLTEEPYLSFIQNLGLPLLSQALTDPPTMQRIAPFLAHIEDVLRRFLASKSKVDAYEEAQERRILIGIVSTPKDLVEDKQLSYRRYFQDLYHPELGETLRYPGPPARLSQTPWRLQRRPPFIGEHNAEVYSEIGLGAEEMADLKGAGVI
jgi:benzylsuccinate CoA-transferase BbsE subunit